MHNKVVYRMARGLRKTGAVVLRFNFRGVNLSEGEHAHGVGEIDDARAALDFLRCALSRSSLDAGRLLLRLAGRTAARLLPAAAAAAHSGGRVSHQGPGSTAISRSCGMPKVFIQSTHDEHGPRAGTGSRVSGFCEPKEIHWVEAKDHFFAGALDAFEACGHRPLPRACMKNVIVGTAGHIDHGKTALVKALTGIDADRLAEEKRRGITIDLGFAHLALTPEIRIGLRRRARARAFRQEHAGRRRRYRYRACW